MEQRTLHPLENEAWSRARESRKRAIFNIWLAGHWHSLLLAVAFLHDPSRGPAKEQLSLLLRRSLATCAELLKIIPNWDPFFRQFPPSGALLHFGSHRYQRQSSHYVKARSPKQSSFSSISLRHTKNYKEGDFYLVPLSFLTRRNVGSLQIKNIAAGASGKRLKEHRPGRPTTVSSHIHWKHF